MIAILRGDDEYSLSSTTDSEETETEFPLKDYGNLLIKLE